MTIEEIKEILKVSEHIAFKLPNGKLVPAHFHVTEVGKVTKNFIDCGGTLRNEEVANFQLWSSYDYNHRLHPEKLVDIILLSQKLLQIGDLPIEVEYQGETIGKYGLDFDGTQFLLTSTQTECLASDSCGVPGEKVKVALTNLKETAQSCCTPNSGCC